MRILYVFFVMLCMSLDAFSAGIPISYDPHEIYYQGQVYQGVQFVGLEIHPQRKDDVLLSLSDRMDPALLDYACAMIWPGMTVGERQIFLEELIVLDDGQIQILALFEEQMMFPETMHPLNRIKVVQRVNLFKSHEILSALEQIIISQEITYAQKEKRFSDILSLESDFYPGNNGFIETLVGGLDEVDHGVVIELFQKAKHENMRAGLCARALIDIATPLRDRVYSLQEIAKFQDAENAVLLNTDFARSFQRMQIQRKVSLLKDLSRDPKDVALRKMHDISRIESDPKGKRGKKKITLPPLG